MFSLNIDLQRTIIFNQMCPCWLIQHPIPLSFQHRGPFDITNLHCFQLPVISYALHMFNDFNQILWLILLKKCLKEAKESQFFIQIISKYLMKACKRLNSLNASPNDHAH